MNRFKKLCRYVNERGVRWVLLYIIRFICMRMPYDMTKVIHHIERSLINIERDRFLTGDSTVSASYHTVEKNRSVWDSNDWSRYGEEWTADARTFKGVDPLAWKQSLIDGMMFKYIGEDSVVLEIGPGAGRWTEILQPVCRRLLIADISEKCLSICRERFKACCNIEYHWLEEASLPSIPDEAIDYIWSYDVFVHISPTDTEKYLIEFMRTLRPGGCAIIHHADAHLSDEEAKSHWRSYMDRQFFAHLVEKHGFRLIEQNDSLVHKPGDLISVFQKPQTTRESLTPAFTEI